MQHINRNLSHNHFKSLRLDDGFEDLTNLRSLDLSANSALRAPSPRSFLKQMRLLQTL